MWLDRVSNPGPPALELDALPTAPHGPVQVSTKHISSRKGTLAQCAYACLTNTSFGGVHNPDKNACKGSVSVIAYFGVL